MSMHSLPTKNVFDTETTKILASALDAAWEEVKTSDGSPAGEQHAAATRELLAKYIIALAQRGEKNLNRLIKNALRRLGRDESPMFDKCENRLLAALGPTADALLRPHLSTAYFAKGAILQEQEAPVAHVYFPMSGLVSLVSVMENGQEIETAVVGRDGAVGAFVGVGSSNAFARATVQIPATCAIISESHFHVAVSQSERIRDLILGFKEALLGQVQQTAACNALHPLESRLARWLLQGLDLTDERELPLTHDSIANLLGVRRTSVTLVANRLQTHGLIRYRRGHIVVLNRTGLEDAACECYRAIRRRTDNIARAPASSASAWLAAASGRRP
jgi:CRP-like cAMP-binding protein